MTVDQSLFVIWLTAVLWQSYLNVCSLFHKWLISFHVGTAKIIQKRRSVFWKKAVRLELGQFAQKQLLIHYKTKCEVSDSECDVQQPDKQLS